MKSISRSLLVVCVLVCFQYGIGQVADIDPSRQSPESGNQAWLIRYNAIHRNLLMGYLQSWTENMQGGIKRLNTQPQQQGVTPINGALLLAENDLSLPARGKNLPITRRYDSKIWYGDSAEVDTFGFDRLRAGFWMGQGWDLHCGRYWKSSANSSIIIYESPSGIRTNFVFSPSQDKYVATDGSFDIIKNDTLKSADGSIIVFDNNPSLSFLIYYTPTSWDYVELHSVKKLIDKNGNINSFFYSSTAHLLGYDYNYYPLDSVKTSTNEKVVFHYQEAYGSGDYAYMLLDSITFSGFDDNNLRIAYHYVYDSTIVSPFGNDFVNELGSPFTGWSGNRCRPTYLLKSVIYPNGDSVYYDYNDYYELIGVHTTSGGVANYEYESYNFYIPHDPIYPPEGNGFTAKKEFARGVKAVIADDMWSAPNTTEYKRIFRSNFGAYHGSSNPDSVTVIDPDGNYQVLEYLSSGRKAFGSGFNWIWENGKLLDRHGDYAHRFYDKTGTLLRKLKSDTRLITPDSIPVIEYTKINNGLATYENSYDDYDSYGHVCLVAEHGDTTDPDDDRWIHRKYLTGTETTSWLRLSFSGYYGNYYACVSFSSLVGIDSLVVKRHWYGGSAPVDSVNTLRYVPPSSQENESFVLRPYPENDTLVTVEAWAYYSSIVLHVWSNPINLAPITPIQQTLDNDHLYDFWNDYQGTLLHDLLTEEYITSDSAGDDILSKTEYFYDDANNVVKIYDSPVQWQMPSNPANLCGNLTRIEQWKGGNDCARTEFRYDNVGNRVMTIVHPDDYHAETTFTHYDLPLFGPRAPDKYNYAYPWRAVNHVSGSCSLSTRTEYDVHTGLVSIAVDEANSDSTIYEYDNMNRLIRVYQPNATEPSRMIKYKDFENPEAIIDSIKLDNRWIVTETFYNGFGQVIQVKNFDFENTKTIVQNISYNGNGLKDSVCNPYEIPGISFGYAQPSWLQITSFQYDGLNRNTQVTHPDNNNINIKHYAYTDTVIDEKGNRTTYVYNAYGAIDTVIDALGNRAAYAYDLLGNLLKVTDATNKETKYYYDNLGRIVAMNGSDARSPYFYDGDSVDVLYEYDDMGNLLLKKDAHGWASYTYDNVNRLLEVKHSTDQGMTWFDRVSMVYDMAFISYGPESEYMNPVGRLGKTKTIGSDSILFFYDDRGNLTRKVTGMNGLYGLKLVTYKYNQADLCTLLVATGGGNYQAKYNYNQLGQIKEMPGLVNNFKYNPAGEITKINFPNGVMDTLIYDSRLRQTQIRTYKYSDILKLGYTYEDNSNVVSIVDYVSPNNNQTFAYDNMNRLTSVNSATGNQSFTYDAVGNRMSKNGMFYEYYDNTNRLKQDHRGYTYNYDDNGNITSRAGSNCQYDWSNRLARYRQGLEYADFGYDASGLRVKKHFHSNVQAETVLVLGGTGSQFSDATEDLGLKSEGLDSIYNKGRDIEKVIIGNAGQYLDITIINKYLFRESGKLKLFLTLDLDTLENSGSICLPVGDPGREGDTMTKVPENAAWEYCIYVEDNNYGVYQFTNNQLINIPLPSGIFVQQTYGPDGQIKISISKQYLKNIPAIRYTVSTFDPIQLLNPSPDTLLQGGSLAADVFPGTNQTFGGEINGYGEITLADSRVINDYTIYYVYDGIEPILEYTPSGSMLAKYVYANGRHIAKILGADTLWYHCDALGSPRKMTNESGNVVWSATYYPFGEMNAGSSNTHGFTGKEFDSEMGLNYFCQRYYDPEIGRFMELDAWTNLPDDERLLSYDKYLSWDNYQMKYEPEKSKGISEYRLKYRNQNLAYDTLSNTLHSLQPHPSLSFAAASIRIYPMNLMNYGTRLARFFTYNHQLNGYLYCMNNPLKYVDPTGNLFDERDWIIFIGTVIGAILGSPGGFGGSLVMASLFEYGFAQAYDNGSYRHRDDLELTWRIDHYYAP